MKKSILIIAVLFSVLSSHSQTPSNVRSKITTAKMFLKGANITRTAKVNIEAGKSKIAIVDLPYDIDLKSIKLRFGKDVSINNISSNYNYEEKQKLTSKRAKLQESIDSLQDKIDRKNLDLSTIQDKIDLIEQNSNLTQSQSTNVVSDLGKMLAIYESKLKDYRKAVFQHKTEIKEIDEEKDLIQQQFNLSRKKKIQPTLEIVAEVSATKALDTEIVLEYYTKNAAWYPKYDARVHDIGKDLKLNLKAQIIQSTPENWEDVKIYLSNALPDRSSTYPRLEKWQLTYSRYTRIKNLIAYGSEPFIGKVSGIITDTSGEPLIGANVLVKGSTIGTITDLDGFYEMSIPHDAKFLEVSYVGYRSKTAEIKSGLINFSLNEHVALDEVVVTGYALSGRTSGLKIRGASSVKQEPKYAEVSEKHNAIEYEILELQDLTNDGASKIIQIKDYDLPALYEFHSVPKIKADVYIIAQIPNWDQYYFLEGEMNLYFEETYVGQSILSPNSFSDTLELSLGKDYNVKIKREEVSSNSRKNFIGSSRIDSRKYRIVVGNQKSASIKIFIHDQYPVSIMKDVNISLEESSGAKLNEEEGELIWNFNLPPKSTKEISFSYKVKYPKREKIILD